MGTQPPNISIGIISLAILADFIGSIIITLTFYYYGKSFINVGQD